MSPARFPAAAERRDVFIADRAGRSRLHRRRRDRPLRQFEHSLGRRERQAHTFAGQRRRRGHRDDGQTLHHHHEPSKSAALSARFNTSPRRVSARGGDWRCATWTDRRRAEPSDHQHGNFFFRCGDPRDDPRLISSRASPIEQIENETGWPLRLASKRQRNRAAEPRRN